MSPRVIFAQRLCDLAPPTVTNAYQASYTVLGVFTCPLAIAGGGQHSLALKSDGTVAAWGESSSGQTTISAGVYLPAEINRRR